MMGLAISISWSKDHFLSFKKYFKQYFPQLIGNIFVCMKV